MKPLPSRIALVGCGHIAEAHAQAISALSHDSCQLVGLCDVDRIRATHFAAQIAVPVPIHEDLTSLLRETAPDVVIMCTPPSTHFALATQCLEAGVAVLCEKPLTTESTTAQQLIKLAQDQNVNLRTTAKYRFVDGVLEAQRLAQSGDLGQIVRLEIAFGAPTPVVGSWHVNRALSGGGVLMDNGPHAFDLARFFVGDVSLASTQFGYHDDYNVEAEASVQLESQAGVSVQIELSWRRALKSNYLVIECEQGVIQVGWSEARYQRNDGEWCYLAGGYDKKRAFYSQLKAFLELDDSRQNTANWALGDGVRVLEIVEAAYL